MKKIGLGISAWNRPQYFSQLISSLEENIIGLADVDCHLFIDGDICAFTNKTMTEQKLIDECVDIWNKALLPQKQIHRRFNNVSVAIHQYEMMQYLTNVYEKVIFLEDDVVVSPNFVWIMKRVLNQYENDDEVFSVSPGFKLLCKPDQVENDMDKIMFSEGHFWAEAIWSKKWRKILPLYNKYMDIVGDREYRSRDSQAILKLFQDHGRKMPATSQDNAKDWAISRTKMKRSRFVVNRATGIGEVGIHSTKEKFAKTGDGNNKIYVFEEEKSINKFQII